MKDLSFLTSFVKSLRASSWEVKLSAMTVPPLLMRFFSVFQYSMCSYFVASKNARSNFCGVLGIAFGAWPKICAMCFESPDFLKFSVASGKRFLKFDSIV